VKTLGKDRRKLGTRKLCYCCGDRIASTKDHVPPRSFFPAGDLPGVKLITAPSCEPCNARWRADGDLFRAYFLTNENTSAVGKAIAREKIFSESGQKHPQYQALRKSFRRVTLSTPAGPRPGGAFVMEPKIVQRVMVHITKAMLYNLYSDKWSATGKFTHRCFSDRARGLSVEEVGALTNLLPLLQHCVVMKDVFEFYHGYLPGAAEEPVWVFGFFGGCWFMVTRSLKTA
jgi:hypothetical protein